MEDQWKDYPGKKKKPQKPQKPQQLQTFNVPNDDV